MYCDRRIGGLDKWFLERPPDHMQIPDEIRQCVLFVGFAMADGSRRIVGTAFLVTRETDGSWFTYAVTAKHVLTKIKDLGINEVMLRMNVRGLGPRWGVTKLSDWHSHPTDERIDVAVLNVALSDTVEFRTFPIAGAATAEVIAANQIGIGDEVFLTGLFSPHVGADKNIPIIRTGNIAAMPEEPVNTKVGKIDAYLIEARSIGGLSGSPVFVYLPEMRGRQLMSNPRFFLLGVMQGHFNSERPKADYASDDALTEETINMGIGIVVPIEKVIEVMNQPKITKSEQQMAAERREKNLPSLDMVDVPDPPFTKDDFEDALKRASRRLPTSQSDKGK